MPGFSAVASKPIAALPGGLAVVVSAAGVYGTGFVGTVTPIITTQVLSSGAMLGFGPIVSTAIAAIVSSSVTSITVYPAGVRAIGAVGTVFLPGSDLTITVSRVNATGVVNSVVIITTPIVFPLGVYAVGAIGNVTVRGYVPVVWIPINTAGGRPPNWQQIST